MKVNPREVLLALTLLLLVPGLVLGQEKDVRGSKDHPLISRYPGSVITGYEATEFDEVILPLGKLDTKRNPEKSERLEGDALVVRRPGALAGVV